MAVELGLNTFVAKPPVNETDFQLLERRNRERTYLVLFVHDRSLSMQTGRHWMLPEVIKTTWSPHLVHYLPTYRMILSGMQTHGMNVVALLYGARTWSLLHLYNCGGLRFVSPPDRQV
jgi:hypothetical protein